MLLMLSYKIIKNFMIFFDIFFNIFIYRSYYDNIFFGYFMLGKLDMWKSKNIIQNFFWKVDIQLVYIFIYKNFNKILF